MVFPHTIFVLMQKIADFVNSVINNYHIDSSIIQNVRGLLFEQMKVDGWISLILSNRECVILEFDNGEFMDEGFVVNDEKVLKVVGNTLFGPIAYNEQRSIVVEGIVDLDHGSRFEGLVLTDEKEGNIGIPFGYGEMYDDDGFGLIEYEGYWCNDNRFGIGKVYDRSGKLVNDCLWYNGIESKIDAYEGDGSEPLNIEMKYLKLTDNCVLVNWDVSLLYNLESIEIGNVCFGSVKTFKIDGLNRLKTIKIGNNSFTLKKNSFGDNESKSFRILNCESLESIQIGEYSFSDFGGEFELKNLTQLRSIQIGTVGSYSYNFWCSSFVIRGIDVMLNI